MTKSFIISHLCIVVICVLLFGCSLKEEKFKSEDPVAREDRTEFEQILQMLAVSEPGELVLSEKECRPQEPKAEPARKEIKDDPVSPNLMWSQPSPGPMYYSHVRDYCWELKEEGFNDWRPATPAELRSRMKDCSEFKDVPNRKGDFSLDVALGNYWHLDGCLWGLKNDAASKVDDWNAYEIVIPKQCVVESWSPCNACQWDICKVSCVRESSPEKKPAKAETKKAKVDLTKLQWSKNTMFDRKNYSASLLSPRHFKYSIPFPPCDCWRLNDDFSDKTKEEIEQEKEDYPCGSDPDDCHVYEIFGVYDPYSYCSNLREGGFSDWRLPTLDELSALKVRQHGTNAYGENYALFLSKNKTGKGNWIFDPVQNRTFLIEVWARHFPVSESKGLSGDTNVVCVRDKKASDNRVKLEKKPVRPLPDPEKLTWSSVAPKAMSWKEAQKYCSDLKENDSSDWRLPNIDELRTLIKNCDQTELNGECKISENRQCLDEKCWSESCNGCSFSGAEILRNRMEAVEKKLAEDYGEFWSLQLALMKERGLNVEEYEKYWQLKDEYEKQKIADFRNSDFSTIGSKETFWSSTLDSENIGAAWGIDFLNARVGHMTLEIDVYSDSGSYRFPDYSSDYKLQVVCVRNNQ